MADVKPLTKSQILDYLAKKTGATKKMTGQFVEEFVALAYKEAKKQFVVPGLGKLVVASRKKRMGRNPQTGETMVIPARKVLKFRIAKQAKDAILGPKK
jgi:DNA-binding protein HU-beta